MSQENNFLIIKGLKLFTKETDLSIISDSQLNSICGNAHHLLVGEAQGSDIYNHCCFTIQTVMVERFIRNGEEPFILNVNLKAKFSTLI